MKRNNYKHSLSIFFLLSIFVFPTNQVLAQVRIDPRNLEKPEFVDTGVVWPEIIAQSAFVYDPISNKILYQKNADEVRPMASLNKIMTAAVADDLINIAPNLAEKQLKITKYRDANRADITLKTGSIWNTEELLKYMLIGSSNKAAETIASSLIPRSSFLSLMNFTARRLGLSSTQFYNPTGLTEFKKKGKETLSSPGGISTAREVAYMTWRIIENHPGLLEITQLPEVTFSNGTDVFSIDNTDILLKDFPIVASKTGFTKLAGGNLAVVIQRDQTSHAYVIVVLGSTEEDRFKDVAALASTTLALTNIK